MFCARAAIAGAAAAQSQDTVGLLAEIRPFVTGAIKAASKLPATALAAARVGVRYHDSLARLLTAAAPMVAEPGPSESHPGGATVQIAIGDVSRLLAGRKQANVTEPFLSDVQVAALPPTVDTEQG